MTRGKAPWLKLALLVAFGACFAPPAQAWKVKRKKAKPAEIVIDATYRGVVSLGLDMATMQPKVEDAPVIIDSEAAYEKFVGRIPKTAVSQTSDALASDDPLLAKPAIDFSRKVMIVLESPSISGAPIVDRVEKHAKKTILRVTTHAPSGEAQPTHLGGYTAIVIDKPKLPVVIE
jgi:hypothetical protein